MKNLFTIILMCVALMGTSQPLTRYVKQVNLNDEGWSDVTAPVSITMIENNDIELVIGNNTTVLSYLNTNIIDDNDPVFEAAWSSSYLSIRDNNIVDVDFSLDYDNLYWDIITIRENGSVIKFKLFDK